MSKAHYCKLVMLKNVQTSGRDCNTIHNDDAEKSDQSRRNESLTLCRMHSLKVHCIRHAILGRKKKEKKPHEKKKKEKERKKRKNLRTENKILPGKKRNTRPGRQDR